MAALTRRGRYAVGTGEPDTALLVETTTDRDEEEHVTPSSGSGTNESKSFLSLCWVHPVSCLLVSWWRHIVIVMTPLVFLFLLFVRLPQPQWNVDAAYTVFTIVIIAVFWLTEVIPIAVTGLLPLILFPALGVLSSDQVARNYLKDTNMLFVGGLMMAVAVEKWNLHRRIALSVLRVMGASPRWLLMGFMGTTAFLSMWISNTATAAMMLPIANAVLEEIKEENKLSTSANKEGRVTYTRGRNSEGEELSTEHAHNAENGVQDTSEGIVTVEIHTSSEDVNAVIEDLEENKSNSRTEMSAVECQSDEHSQPESGTETNQLLNSPNAVTSELKVAANGKQFNRTAKALMLGVAYAANIGGTATLTGTGPNIILGGLAGDLGVNFGLWFAFAAPPMILALICSWLYLSFIFCDDSFIWCKQKLFGRKFYKLHSTRAKEVIKEQYKKLGKIRYAEVLVLVSFIVLVLLWFTREPGFIPGWGVLFKKDANNNKSYFTDTTTVLVIVVLLFILPSQPCCCSNWIGAGRSPRLLDWKSVQSGVPWNVVIVLGSGFALAAGAYASGLSELIGNYLTVWRCLPASLMAFIVSVLVAIVTEVLSNVATTTLFLPILRSLAIELCVHPLYLMLPATISASYAFMLPVATPPNTIAFTYGYLKVYEMVLIGFFMNILCIAIVSIAVNSLGLAIFNLNTFPTDLANGTMCNSTGSYFILC